ncbi:uncharacterized protein LOC116428966 isoform X2 [Nomia melanderi]|uniref:uncharacterized protein LOC116428966 isoform X2 n=1 Tax=Nomia melanderi TaxID=2448451 RepID=UPI0013047898|nr:uncharacterized protein LOC116428966 isoform X2 [Nomia melanderi]
MTTDNKSWDDMLKIAKIQQQEYYELLSQWTIYNEDEYKYLKQNIGFSIFGPPTESNTSISTSLSTNVTDSLHYTNKAQKVIDRIFKQIQKFGEMNYKSASPRNKKCICYGVIFNVTLPIKSSSLKESEIYAQPISIFKIITRTDTVLYIDIHGRVYKSWENYKTNNTLPKCTMVLPMNGFYQFDKSYEITEEYSIVWLEIVNSPACKVARKVIEGVDIAATVVGVAGMGVGLLSMVTPVGPLVLGAAAVSGIGTGAWGIGRSTQNLVDRSKHEQSISLRDREALCSWLTITGSAVGLAATGGSVLLVKAVKNGRNISTAAKLAFNSLVVGNVSLNGVGIAFQGYCMYKRYQEEQVVRSMDVLNLVTHVLFFGNAVMNMQLAGNLIETTQGKILDNYRNSLRTKRLRKSFNRAKRAAAANNAEKIQENAEVIRYINAKNDMLFKQNNVPINSVVTFEGGKIKLYGNALLDPIKFLFMLLREDRIDKENYESNNSSDTERDNPMISNLKELLLDLLYEYNTVNDEHFTSNFNSYEYDRIIDDMKNMENASETLLLIFKLVWGIW